MSCSVDHGQQVSHIVLFWVDLRETQVGNNSCVKVSDSSTISQEGVVLTGLVEMKSSRPMVNRDQVTRNSHKLWSLIVCTNCFQLKFFSMSRGEFDGKRAWRNAFSLSDSHLAFAGTVNRVSRERLLIRLVILQSGSRKNTAMPRTIVNTPSVKTSLESTHVSIDPPDRTSKTNHFHPAIPRAATPLKA